MIPTLASYGKRVIAFLIDYFIVVLFVYIIGYIFFDVKIPVFITGVLPASETLHFEEDKFLLQDVSFAICVTLSWLLDSTKLQGTIGKIVLKLKVVDENFNKLTFKQAALRNLFKFISFYSFLLGFVYIFFNKERRALHDILRKTLIIKR